MKFSVNVKERQDKLHAMYWLPKLHKNHIKQGLSLIQAPVPLLNFNYYQLFVSLLLKLIAIKTHVIRYCKKVFERSDRNLFWSMKNSGEVLNRLKKISLVQFNNTSFSYALYTFAQ